MTSLHDLDAHQHPPDWLRAEFVRHKKQSQDELLSDPNIDNPRSPPHQSSFKSTGDIISKTQLCEAFSHLGLSSVSVDSDVPILYHPLLPDLLIIPDLIPPTIQIRLMDLMAHRDLSVPHHSSNLSLHYRVPYPPSGASLFSLGPDDDPSSSSSSPSTFQPLDPSVHRALTPRQALNRRLSWVTLGGQYDWTRRVYPECGTPPPFPPDLASFLRALFPQTVAQAAIVNFYTPGDTMMMHRDVSERVDRGLVSLSLGCDGIFMIAPPDAEGDSTTGASSPSSPSSSSSSTTTTAAAATAKEGTKKYLLLRLRSGDAVYMTGQSRRAFHGVPKILRGTCPSFLEDWPATADENGPYERWRGWMKNKRINLNVRQMEHE